MASEVNKIPMKTNFLPIRVLFILTLVLILNGCSRNWLVYRGRDGSGYTAATVAPPLGVKWKLLLQNKDNRRESFNPPAVWGSMLYFGSADGNLYALDIRTGYMRWVFRTGGPLNSVPTADKKSVFIGSSDGKIYCLDRQTGELQWSFATKAAVNSTIVISEDKVYAISDMDAQYCLDRETGELLWSLPNQVWMHNSFQIYDNVLYFSPGPPERAYSLTGLDLDTQQFLWFVDTDGDEMIWYSFPAVKDNSLFYGTAGLNGEGWVFSFVCLDRMTGDLIWRREGEGHLPVGTDSLKLFEETLSQLDYMAPAVYKNKVYFTAGDRILRVFHKKTGEQLNWIIFDQPLTGAPLIGGSRLFIGLKETGDLPGQLVCLNAENGRELWRMEIEGSLLSAPVISGKWLIFGTDRNIFYVLEEVF
jgi:outer membrane protein assembly factor BamB